LSLRTSGETIGFFINNYDSSKITYPEKNIPPGVLNYFLVLTYFLRKATTNYGSFFYLSFLKKLTIVHAN
jgi:hypothetical protein